MIAYKLLRKRKNGTLGSLFINKRAIIPKNEWLVAEDHPTKGYKHRPAWHCVAKPHAPHLSDKGRVWCIVHIEEFISMERHASQGGIWYLAQRMYIISQL